MTTSDNYLGLFKKTIIVFWTLWWLIALWTDVVGILAHQGLLVKSWAPDTNYPFLLESLAMYHPPFWFAPLCFGVIVLWSLLSTLAFIWAFFSLNQSTERWMHRANIAFIISLSFWMAFFLADQMVMKFDLEENHMVQGGFQLLTWLTLYVLPREAISK